MTQDSTHPMQAENSFEVRTEPPADDLPAATPQRASRLTEVWTMLLLVLILCAGLALRTLGLFWGEEQYLHPDERFLLMVGTNMSPTKMVADPETGEARKQWMSIGEYFDTAHSTLNPHNVGHTYFVYGTLPMFMTRITAELLYKQVGLTEMTEVGRTLSALMDLLAVWVVFLVAEQLYNRKVALLAAAFYAVAVLPIQQAHFFTTDTFISFFTLLAIYIAVRVGKVAGDGLKAASRHTKEGPSETGLESLPGENGVIDEAALAAAAQHEDERDLVFENPLEDGGTHKDEVVIEEQPVILSRPNTRTKTNLIQWLGWFWRSPFLGLSIAFGLALGCAVASKLNAVPVAAMLPAAFILWLLNQPRGQREKYFGPISAYLILAAFISLLTFRIAQPYAFTGPGFFGVTPNISWIENIVSQQAQAAGDVDFPPAIQWAQRPIWFSAKNLTVWGLGLPLGLLAWAGFLWAGWRMFTHLKRGGEWKQHFLLWGWMFVYFTWQSLQANPTMRYQFPIYPTLAIFAAWAVFGGRGSKVESRRSEVEASGLGGEEYLQSESQKLTFDPSTANRVRRSGQALQLLTLPLGALVLIATALYAWNFVHDIYLTPITRIAASRWIFQNIPGAVNVRIQPKDAAPGEAPYNQPLPWYGDSLLQPGQPMQISFTAKADGLLEEVYIHKVTSNDGATLPGSIKIRIDSGNTASPSSVEASAEPEVDAEGGDVTNYHVRFERGFPMVKGSPYNLSIEIPAEGTALHLNGSAIANEGSWDDAIPMRVDEYDGYGGIYRGGLEFNMYDDDNEEKRARIQNILDQADYILISSNRQWGSLQQIPQRFPLSLTYYRNLIGCPEEKNLFWCYAEAKPGMFTSELGFDLVTTFESPITIGPLTFNDQFAEEAFSVYDHPKVHIFKKNANYDSQKTADILNSVDLTKVVHLTPKKAGTKIPTLMLPEALWKKQLEGGTWSELFSYDALLNRFPWLGLVAWYLAILLLGWVTYPFVRAALPGLQDRGYPVARIAGLVLLAWLAWMGGFVGIAYTRLTITIFILVIALFSALLAYWQREGLARELREKRRYFLAIEGVFLAFFVFDLLIRLGNPDLWHAYKGGEKPMDFAYFNALIKSTVFPPYDPWFSGGYLNYYYYGFMVASVMVKWLGIVPSIAYNLLLPTWFAMTGMGAFSVAWNLVSSVEKGRRACPERRTLFAVEGSKVEGRKDEGLQVEGPQAESLKIESSQVEGSQAESLEVEGLQVESLEVESPKVENFSTVEESTFDPSTGSGQALRPFDTLRAGPSTFDSPPPEVAPLDEVQHATVQQPIIKRLSAPWVAGLAAALIMVVFGNLATPGVIINAWARMVVSSEEIKVANPLQVLQWAAQGAGKAFGGENLAIYPGDLYWIPSRAIPFDPGEVEPITEFPFFTFLYADPHAHLWVLPIALLALAWGTSFVLQKSKHDTGEEKRPWWVGILQGGLVLFLGGLAIGALWPTNSWDFPANIAIGVCVVVYAQLCHFDGSNLPLVKNMPLPARRLLAMAIAAGLLVALSWNLYAPYREWFALGYTKAGLYEGSRTPLSAYFIHWGLFLFVIVSWLAWEARDWMVSTPLSSLRKLAPYQAPIYAALALVLIVMAFVTIYFKADIGWFVLLLVAWAGVLILRPGQPDAKRLVLFLFGTALMITLTVEIVVLGGDIGRMNTVFKFYLQAWTLLAVSAGAALGWLWQDIPRWRPNWRATWQIILGLLAATAAMYTVIGGSAKMRDRMIDTAPHTLDGMAYMETATYSSRTGELDLNQDYLAIRWMQENVQGSPVIVESGGEGIQYDWFSRFAIYTGLPDVVGWQWHQEQQRTAIQPNPVAPRGQEVRAFYEATDRQAALDFINKYNASYIIVGQLERGFYPGPGLDKFDALNGDLWQEVYRDRDMVIYQVIR